MQISFLIVTKNRVPDLQITLQKLKQELIENQQEVLVFIDGCQETEKIKAQYPWVKWFGVEKSISASPARNFLYKQARGAIFIGLDDDANLITPNATELIQSYFKENTNLGILAFKEVKGIYSSDDEVLNKVESTKIEYLTNDFIGCGFAIKKDVYLKTNGFPLWIDIYGEEPAVAKEVLELDYAILYTNQIVVNHRVDIEKRKQNGKNYFRFKKQLHNSAFLFLVYEPKPFMKILKLLYHNFKKYALSDVTYFKLFWEAIFILFLKLIPILKIRKPLSTRTIEKIKNLKPLHY